MISQKKLEINELSVDIYNLILKFQTESINMMTNEELTLNEVHTLSAIYTNENKSMSKVAGKLGIKSSTLTVTVARLEKKGFLIRKRSKHDKRAVLIELTDRGYTAVRAHDFFHKKIVDNATEGLDEAKIDVLLLALKNILKVVKDNKKLEEFMSQCQNI